MQKRAHPPQGIHRFNYWRYFAPKTQHQLVPSVQRLGEYPEVAWSARPGHTALHRHIQQDFQLLLHATPDIWEEKVFPVHHVKLTDIPNQQVYALEYYIRGYKDWEQDPEAQRVKKQLTPRQRAAIQQLDNAIWPKRSQRPARLKRTWKELFKDIARDQETFERLCENPPAPDTLRGTEARIYKNYSPQAIELLGAIFIAKPRRNIYRDLLDGSSLLTPSGWLRGKSIIGVNWLDLSRKDRRAAKKRTLHWFHHALRNMRDYRHRRPETPWTAECEKQCRRIQQKLLNS